MKAKPRGFRYHNLYALAALILALGCAGGVQRYGPDKFIVSESDFTGVAGAREKAVRTANRYCDELGETMVPLSEEASGGNSMSLLFRCGPPAVPSAVPTR
jgi:hypothetical protein